MTQATEGAAAPVPSDVNYHYYLGPVYTIVGADETLLQAGIVKPSQIPQKRSRCNITPRDGSGIINCWRLPFGQLRVQAFATAIIDRDAPFKRFLGAILADVRLSLVQGEKNV